MTAARTNRDYLPMVLLLLSAAGTFALFQIPALFGGKNDDTDHVRAHRERIANMTQAERERLRRRADRYFEELTESDRQRLRQLHRDLQTHPNADELKRVMQKYNEWLASLSAYEQKELRDRLENAQTLEDKRQIVEEFQQKQDEERYVRSLDDRSRKILLREPDWKKRRQMIERFRGARRGRRRFSRSPSLDSPKLDQVVRFIESRLSLSQAQTEMLNELSPAHRHIKVMVLAMNEHLRRRKQDGSGLLEDATLRPRVEKEIADSDLKQHLLDAMGSRRSKYGILFLITRSIYHERRKLRGKPTEEQLKQFVQTLDPQRKDKLMRYRGSEKRDMLNRWYFYGGETGDDYQEFRRLSWRFMMRNFGRSRSSRRHHNPQD